MSLGSGTLLVGMKNIGRKEPMKNVFQFKICLFFLDNSTDSENDLLHLNRCHCGPAGLASCQNNTISISKTKMSQYYYMLGVQYMKAPSATCLMD